MTYGRVIRGALLGGADGLGRRRPLWHAYTPTTAVDAWRCECLFFLLFLSFSVCARSFFPVFLVAFDASTPGSHVPRWPPARRWHTAGPRPPPRRGSFVCFRTHRRRRRRCVRKQTTQGGVEMEAAVGGKRAWPGGMPARWPPPPPDSGACATATSPPCAVTCMTRRRRARRTPRRRPRSGRCPPIVGPCLPLGNAMPRRLRIGARGARRPHARAGQTTGIAGTSSRRRQWQRRQQRLPVGRGGPARPSTRPSTAAVRATDVRMVAPLIATASERRRQGVHDGGGRP